MDNAKNKLPRHPDRNFNEIQITNTSEGDSINLHWRTKRLGTTAFGPTGNLVKGLKPLFVRISEYKERMDKKTQEGGVEASLVKDALQNNYDSEHIAIIETIEKLRKLAATPEGEHPEEETVKTVFADATKFLKQAALELGILERTAEHPYRGDRLPNLLSAVAETTTDGFPTATIRTWAEEAANQLHERLFG
jgi:hypothetical protein